MSRLFANTNKSKNVSPLVVLCFAIIAGTAGCASETVAEREKDGFVLASPVLQREIDQRIDNLRYQHNRDLLASMQRLITIGEPAIPALVKALKSDDPKTRSSVAFVLGEIGDQRAVKDLTQLLTDSVESVRFEGAAAVVTLGDWTAMPVLIQA